MRDLIERAKSLMGTGNFFDTRHLSREAEKRGIKAEQFQKMIDIAANELKSEKPKK